MAILSKLFTPKWQHKDPSVRRRGLKSLSSDKQRISFIERETEAELIHEALSLLANESLTQLSRHSQNQIMKPAKRELLARLLDNGQLPTTAATNTYIDIASLTDDSELRLQAVQKIDDETACLRLALEHPVAKVRLAAADNIHNQDYLVQLSSQSQGKDKSVYRLCKDKLNQLRDLAEQQAQQENAIAKCAEQLQVLVKQGYGPDFVGRLQILEKNWSALSDQAPASIQQEVESSLKQAQHCLLLQRQQEEQIRQQEQQEKLAFTQRQTIIKSVSQGLQEFVQANWQDVISDTDNQIQPIDNQLTAWQALAATSDIDKSQQQEWQPLNKDWQAIKTLIEFIKSNPELSGFINAASGQAASEANPDQDGSSVKTNINPELVRQIKWPQSLTQPQWLDELYNTLKKSQKKEKKSKQPSATNSFDQAAFQTLADDVEQALDQGQAKQAANLLKKLNQVTGQQRISKSASAQINRLKARLQELRDWQGFATTPKQIELCEQMEALLKIDKDPEQLAADIKALQQQWKQLGGSGTDQQLWQRFQEAANAAYIPCQKFYDEQAVLRQQRVSARHELIQQLTDYEGGLDWQQADWKMVQQTLNSARQSFRTLAPVDRQQHKTTSEAMDAICDRIYGHLKDEYDRNLAKLKLLVGRAETQCANDDLQQATDTIKQLQQEWKTVGVTPRNADQPLWRQFRQHCDAVFERLKEQRQQRKQGIEQDIAIAEAAVNELIAEGPSISLSAAQEKTEALTQRIAELTLPKQVEQKIRKQISTLLNDTKQRRQQQKEDEKQQSWTSLLNLIEFINDDSVLPAVERLPAEFTQQEIEAVYCPSESEITVDNDKALQTLCVQLEILADIDSPKQASDIRMQLQVERLAKGLGQQDSLVDQRKQIILQWLSLAGRSTYLNRFMTALRHII